jgi:hypothetical protein
MTRKCPSCKSYNARRSTVRTSEVTLRHVFLSPYRCRECRARFWVLSRNSYTVAATLCVVAIVGVAAWNAPALIADMPASEPDPAAATAPRLADLLKLAAANDANAERELARMYASGYGVQKSLQEEQKWLERSAQHGNVQAQYELAVALRDGHGTVQDYEQAKKWMQLAAEGSNGSAQLALGIMYRTGVGIPIDNVKAYVWLNVAAAQGVPGAAGARDAVLPRLTAAELQDAQAEARRLSALYIPKATPPQ